MFETEEYPKEYEFSMRKKDLVEQGIHKVGVALFIVDLDTKKLWTVRENFNKSSTGREVGMVTVPLETRKIVGGRRLEFTSENIYGALDEFRELQGNEELVCISHESPDKNNSYKGRFELIDGVAADIVIIGLRNRSAQEIQTTKSDEVVSAGWQSLDELIAEPNLRTGVIGLLRLIKKRGWIDEDVDYMNANGEGVSAMYYDNYLSSVERDALPDIEI